MINRLLLVSLAIFFPATAFAAEKCQAKSLIKTQFGVLTDTTCSDEKGFTLRESISLDSRKLLEDQVLIGDLAFDKNHAHWIYAGPVDPSTNCSSKLYMIDISVTPATVFEFGVKDACNEYEWASWGKGASVISLKENVRFLYKNRKMIPPKADQSLLQTIKMPADAPDTGIFADKLIPFANDLMEKPVAK